MAGIAEGAKRKNGQTAKKPGPKGPRGPGTKTATRRGARARLLEEQDGLCAICQTTSVVLHLDHDHACCEKGCRKCIRGLLCGSCNWMLGQADDDPEVLDVAAAYLRRGKASLKIANRHEKHRPARGRSFADALLAPRPVVPAPEPTPALEYWRAQRKATSR